MRSSRRRQPLVAKRRQFVIKDFDLRRKRRLKAPDYGRESVATQAETWLMNKQELISQIADRAGLSRNDSSRAVETMLELITGALKRGDEVRLVGFGNFSVTRRKASTGRNPRTGEPMQIKASSQPKFRPGKILKDAVQ
ncbi:HU family DNA-binding protein [Sphingomonas sp. ASV193]|uniref:HU family DNA-binding protein n=1 Tax=Sphingomonas sp. ASV193 TaxID=3144405 RepID=UPI0032E8AACE